MSESLVQVTEGTGKKLHTNQRVIGANTVEDEYVVPGEYPLATYTVTFQSVLVAAANDQIVQLQAGATLKVRVREIVMYQLNSAAAAAVTAFDCDRTTAAGAGGGALTPRPHDTSSPASGATAMTLPNAPQATVGVTLFAWVGVLRQAILATASQSERPMLEWRQLPNAEPLIIPAGAANGLILRTLSARAGASVSGWITFTETSY